MNKPPVLCGITLYVALLLVSQGAVAANAVPEPAMVSIPKGSFTMGSPATEAGRSDDEGPQHEVRIAAFALGKYPVTRAQFAAFVAATGYDAGHVCRTFEKGRGDLRPGRSWRNPGFKQTDDDPVVCVNSDDAKAYTAWLSGQTAKLYRLPTEAEWEYAARAGTTTSRYWGDDPDQACRFADVMDQSGHDQNPGAFWPPHHCDDGQGHTAPVGRYQANAFGLYDMLGNAWEWVQDCLTDNYEGAPADGSAWSTEGCKLHGMRGGSWFSKLESVRSARRGRHAEGDRDDDIGFRVAMSLHPALPEMVALPGGSFMMGSTAAEEGHLDDEGPVHQVTLPGFAIGKYEVTVGQFTYFVAETGYDAGNSCRNFEQGKGGLRDQRNWRRPWGRPVLDDTPVVCVSTDDATAYVQWLSAKTGKHYRLPTEAEWEYAARAGSSTANYLGDSLDDNCSIGNVYDQSGNRANPGANLPGSMVQHGDPAHCDDGYGKTAPVGSFRPNAFGLYDMIGNAWEWVQDCHTANYIGAPVHGEAWITGHCTDRVMRGGSFFSRRDSPRSARRGVHPEGSRVDDGGFRVALDLR